MSGKGSNRRKENYEVFVTNYESINWKSNKALLVKEQIKLIKSLKKVKDIKDDS